MPLRVFEKLGLLLATPFAKLTFYLTLWHIRGEIYMGGWFLPRRTIMSRRHRKGVVVHEVSQKQGREGGNSEICDSLASHLS